MNSTVGLQYQIGRRYGEKVCVSILPRSGQTTLKQGNLSHSLRYTHFCALRKRHSAAKRGSLGVHQPSRICAYHDVRVHAAAGIVADVKRSNKAEHT
jgi:hypothetical protein